MINLHVSFEHIDGATKTGAAFSANKKMLSEVDTHELMALAVSCLKLHQLNVEIGQATPDTCPFFQIVQVANNEILSRQ